MSANNITFKEKNFSLRKISAHQIIPENILLQGVTAKKPHLVQVEISPTDACNQNCKWCFTKQDRISGRFITSNTLRLYLEEFVICGGLSVVFSGGGEPLMYKPMYKKQKYFDDKNLIQFCLDKGLHCGLITNGINLKPIFSNIDIKALTFLRISMDSICEKEYTDLHLCSSNDFSKLMDNIGSISEKKGGYALPAFGISFIVDGNSGLNCSILKLDQIRKFSLEKKVDFVQFKHLHTSNYIQAEQTMQRVHKILKNMEWENVEFWVQKYIAPLPGEKCNVTEIIQSVGSNNQRFPCCHLFGDSTHYLQRDFLPKGKVIKNCPSKVCRYVAINKLLNELQNTTSVAIAEASLKLSLETHGYHPYRFFPTAPDLFFPVSSSNYRRHTK